MAVYVHVTFSDGKYPTVFTDRISASKHLLDENYLHDVSVDMDAPLLADCLDLSILELGMACLKPAGSLFILETVIYNIPLNS